MEDNTLDNTRTFDLINVFRCSLGSYRLIAPVFILFLLISVIVPFPTVKPADDNAKASAFMAKLRGQKRRHVKPAKRITNDLPFGTEDFFDDIAFGRPLVAIPEKFRKLVGSWHGYLNSTAGMSVKITLINPKTGETFDKVIPYVHRWTSTYRKSIVAKLYMLEAYIGVDCKNVEVIALTLAQRGVDPEQSLLLLKVYLKRLLDMMRKQFGTVDYFAIKEPHKTGYPHAHVAYFRKLTEAERKYLAFAWACILEAGSLAHGLHFSEPSASVDGKYESGSIAGIRNYFMKYISKSLRSDDMPLNEQLFNALLWKTGTRTWTCSRHFSEVMARREAEKSDWEFLEACIVDEEGNVISSIPRRVEVTEAYSEEFLYSISAEDSFVLDALSTLVSLGDRVIRPGSEGMLDVFEVHR